MRQNNLKLEISFNLQTIKMLEYNISVQNIIRMRTCVIPIITMIVTTLLLLKYKDNRFKRKKLK